MNLCASIRRDTAVIVPAKNEENTIRFVLERIRETLNPGLILVVDDGSHDGTRALSKRIGVTVAETSSGRRGLGAAMRLGITKARSIGFERFATVDADGQYDPADLLRLMDVLHFSCVDLVVGNRMASGKPERMSAHRYLANSIFSYLFSQIASIPGGIDSQSGIRVFTSRVAARCTCSNNFTYTQEQLLRARLEHLPISSVPVHFGPRRYGQSRLVKSTLDYTRRTVPHLLGLYYRSLTGQEKRTGGTNAL